MVRQSSACDMRCGIAMKVFLKSMSTGVVTSEMVDRLWRAVSLVFSGSINIPKNVSDLTLSSRAHEGTCPGLAPYLILDSI